MKQAIAITLSLLFALSLWSPAAAAQADAVSPSQVATWAYRNLATGRCLDSNQAGEVYGLACQNSGYQRWEIYERPGVDEFMLVNSETARCLDSNAAGAVYTLPCNFGANQTWRVIFEGNVRMLQNVATGLMLDDNGTKIYTHPRNNSYFQKWAHI
ncbi:RICIN domain-containing protein [Parenemella sanctibonifatiensis]|uniref:Xylanase n=1 Tax=Parenemella sanctibonifatiensis TaxID=2016505 RepID=A0A255EKL4_9ACTN|nr:RICIN domain-containing protein [Parenemella sanctibonifatiensis]OYN92079.1 xylanase [Parenemella sanctibonifatiensis]